MVVTPYGLNLEFKVSIYMFFITVHFSDSRIYVISVLRKKVNLSILESPSLYVQNKLKDGFVVRKYVLGTVYNTLGDVLMS